MLRHFSLKYCSPRCCRSYFHLDTVTQVAIQPENALSVYIQNWSWLTAYISSYRVLLTQRAFNNRSRSFNTLVGSEVLILFCVKPHPLSYLPLKESWQFFFLGWGLGVHGPGFWTLLTLFSADLLLLTGLLDTWFYKQLYLWYIGSLSWKAILTSINIASCKRVLSPERF